MEWYVLNVLTTYRDGFPNPATIGYLILDQATLNKYISESESFITERFGETDPEIGIILGSGLGPFAENIDLKHSIDTTEIPHYPASTVPGHKGRLVYGILEGIEILALQGRVHTYEGYEQWQVTYPARLLGALGIKSLIVTNSSGASNPEYEPGSFMLIEDHLNYLFREPLEPWERNGKEVNSPYEKEFIRLAKEVSERTGIRLETGVLSANLGPSYETPAEVDFQRKIGSDSASMSTLPEVTVAHYLGIKVLGLSVLTNYAAGLSKVPLSHEEVTDMAEAVSEKFSKLVTEIIREIHSRN
ncbi:MAG: purine-nucleoside phosphorylase [Candidatus Marinimicrobia bacterium]|nr:purine-nucleoside phosphorylase [Candidatus Neomarinimicrobiota bacterium]